VGADHPLPGRRLLRDRHRDARRPRLRRLHRHRSRRVSARVDASTGRGGLAARHDETHWFGLEAAGDGVTTTVTAHAPLAGLERTWSTEFPAGEVELRMELLRPPTGFVPAVAGGGTVRLVAVGHGSEVVLAEFDGRYWSFEVAKSFTGRGSDAVPG
jgi:hypothetical protein